MRDPVISVDVLHILIESSETKQDENYNLCYTKKATQHTGSYKNWAQGN